MSDSKRVGGSAPAPAHDFTGDEYWGKGGSYVVDPATGKRKPAPAVEEAAPAQAAPVAPAPDAEADPEKNLKEKHRA